MKKIGLGIAFIVLGWFVGSIVNMGFIQLGHQLLPISNVDINNMEELAKAMPNLKPKYFLFPFIGHALGTLAGAFVAALLAISHKIKFALVIGVLFLFGGIAINYMLTGPLWFTISDILLAYIPMAWIGGLVAIRIKRTS